MNVWCVTSIAIFDYNSMLCYSKLLITKYGGLYFESNYILPDH